MEPQTAASNHPVADHGALPTLTDAPISAVLLASTSSPDAFDVVHAWAECLASLKREHEIVVVGPESNADLLALREATSSHPVSQVVIYPGPDADGPALRVALAAVKHPLLLLAPCDKQYQPKELERFLGVINEVHIVSGFRVFQPLPVWLAWLDLLKRVLSRLLLGYWPPRRECWLGAKGWGRRWLARWIFGLRVQDVECRFRLFRREVFERFPIQSRGEFTQIEVLAKANHLNCIMAEVPVSWVAPTEIRVDPTFSADARLVRKDPQFIDPTATSPKELVEPLAPEAG